MSELKSQTLFISVGSRFAMDRLLNSVESVLQQHPSLSARAQIASSDFQSELLLTERWIDQDDFEQAIDECDIFISHAGMGNILLASKFQKPIVIMPRLPHLSEHINDHQIGTCEALRDRPLVHIVNNAQELEQAVFNIANSTDTTTKSGERHTTRASLIASIKEFIDHE